MVKEVIGELFPPDVPAVTRWRLVLFLFCLAVSFHIGWACGFIPGFSGFASASEVKGVADKVDLVLKLQVEARLRTLKQEKCVAKSASLQRALQDEIDRLQHEHRLLDGTHYLLPSCRVYLMDDTEIEE